MILWAVLTLMVALAVVGVTIPLVRRHQARGDAALAVFRDQLADLDTQVANGAVAPEEAEGLRTEIRKRLLAEDRHAMSPARPLAAASYGIALGLAAIVALAATGLYALMGRPDLAERPMAEMPAPASTRAEPSAADVDSMIAQLKGKIDGNPGDPEGWRMLGWSYMQTGRGGEAADAYRRAVQLRPDEPSYLSALGEALVQAASGTVSPEARAIFAKVNKVDPAEPRARYFLALAKGQSGDRRGALDDFVALLNSAPADAPWAPELRPIVEANARELGVDLTGKLKPATAPAPAAAPAAPMPSADQVRAAQSMNPNDRQAMIRGMVEGLAARLKTTPRDLEGWQRLMRARMVLNDAAGAAAAYRDARAAFPGDTPESRALAAAAKDLGIPS